ncbi:MAG TPA: hypothetical protein VG756_32280 [Pseudonocardiaceae bacterium]|jgi:hypothetical protein|nr:hypothetical protein [Pseudonocardiaceae bacterium]
MHLPRKDQPSDEGFAVRRLTRPTIFLLRALVGCALLGKATTMQAKLAEVG